MKLALFSNASFIQPNVRLGLQQLATEWAKVGHQVDYFSCPTHPFDFTSPSRRALWRQGWLGVRQHVVSDNLIEHFLRSPFGRRRFWWRSHRQIKLYSQFFPKALSRKKYDVCIYDVCYSSLNVPRVDASRVIIRLNDNPGGFIHHMSPIVANWFQDTLKNNKVDSVWPVSPSLANWALELNGKLQIDILPNGVSLDAFTNHRASSSREKSRKAVFLGTFQPWFNWDILFEAAIALPDWRIDLYGPLGGQELRDDMPDNIHYMGPVSFDKVPLTLAGYDVGLLPFKPSGSFLDYFDPIKAYQYWAAGLGIAATNVGRMGDALLPWACLGSDGNSFAGAIEKAGEERQRWQQDSALQKHLDESNWSILAKRGLSAMIAS
mgnify:CR=1 FL=1